MANILFVADNTIPGQSAVDLFRRAADAVTQGLTGQNRDYRMRSGLRGLDREMLRDLGLDRGAC